MAYDEKLAKRIRTVFSDRPGVEERKMFGGIAFLLNGNMCCGIVGERLMLRVGAKRHEEALGKPHVTPMDFTGRPMKGMIYVNPEGIQGASLKRWVSWGVTFAEGLPTKVKPMKTKKKAQGAAKLAQLRRANSSKKTTSGRRKTA